MNTSTYLASLDNEKAPFLSIFRILKKQCLADRHRYAIAKTNSVFFLFAIHIFFFYFCIKIYLIDL